MGDTTAMTQTRHNNPALGILLISLGVAAISVNDMLIKFLSGGYPLHQIVFVRSAVGILFTLVFLQWEGGFRALRTATPLLHLLRGLLVVLANLTFYAAVAVLPLAQATALFFVAPLFITLLSIPVLGEKVGPWRLGAVVVGFVGVLVMQQPWANTIGVSRGVLLLPVAAAALYAGMQVLTRRLGVTTRASAMAIYIQGTFLLVSVGFFIVAGDGRFAEGTQNESLIFLLRPWIWPQGDDVWVFLGLGLTAGVVGYTLSAAYRIADAATVAPFEYLGLPLAILWGWAIFAEWPGPEVWWGCLLIVGAGLFVFLREKLLNRPQTGLRRRALRR